MAKFEKGNPGGPGRPRGRRNTSTLFAELIGQKTANEVLKTVVQAACDGNLRAAHLVMARLWPERKDRPLRLDLPRIKKARDIVPAQAAIVRAIAGGKLTPQEGSAMASALESYRRATELADIEPRLEVVEERLDAKRP